MFKDFCHQIGMKVAFASVYHPKPMEQWKELMA
jgi:hypothetical protein